MTVGFKDGVLRVRSPFWVPVEVVPAQVEAGTFVPIIEDVDYTTQAPATVALPVESIVYTVPSLPSGRNIRIKRKVK